MLVASLSDSAAMSTSLPKQSPPQPVAWTDDDLIRHGTPAFRRTNLALFAAGFATFGLLYCVQPLMPQFSQQYGVGAASSALSLSLTTGVLLAPIDVAPGDPPEPMRLGDVDFSAGHPAD